MGLHSRNPFPTNQLASSRYNNDLQNIKNSFNKPAVRPPSEPLVRLPKFATNLGKFLGPVTAGTIGTALGLAVIGNLVTATPTADEDEILRAKRIAQNRGGVRGSEPSLLKVDDKIILLNPSEPAKEISPAVPGANFTGGQSSVVYSVNIQFTYRPNPYNNGKGFNNNIVQVYGPISKVSAKLSVPAQEDSIFGPLQDIEITCRGTTNVAPTTSDVIITLSGYGYFEKLDSASVSRVDGQPDTGGNPPPTQQPILSSPGNALIPSDYQPPEVGSSISEILPQISHHSILIHRFR